MPCFPRHSLINLESTPGPPQPHSPGLKVKRGRSYLQTMNLFISSLFKTTATLTPKPSVIITDAPFLRRRFSFIFQRLISVFKAATLLKWLISSLAEGLAKCSI